jgi:uncharacterized membrane protein
MTLVAVLTIMIGAVIIATIFLLSACIISSQISRTEEVVEFQRAMDDITEREKFR